VTALVLRVIAWLILAYRRWLSGRGPLRRVRCSFPEDSCSTFGLRATTEAPTARIALARIARRLRRCRDACLLGDGRAISWTALHDRSPADIANEMRADGERDIAIDRMLATRRAVAAWRGESDVVQALAPARCPPVYSYPATAARSRRRIAGFLGLATVAAIAVAFRPWLGSIVLFVALAAGLLGVRRWLAESRRFALHARPR
jgi:hypothetical protein